ncbi:putative DNA-directed RNA polymerase subunit beta-beta protein [Thalictrum thalictroides]|uniref:Putative DNA-directed RNA polymerase subunit beta-beta protein n=1 Tax=Thalictrum thalictroides TaxID=46969 RepID=A0A7J6X9D9_THATH|nr:putative DNA-directed RNA polymerase subunit beta-beta protein [Thalictrum thalictroides]
MPFLMKIQPIDCNTPIFRNDQVKPVVKSRFKRLFEWQFSSVSKNLNVDKPCGSGTELLCYKDVNNELEPSSVCLAKMVQNFIEENNEKQLIPVKCNRNRCNCFNGNCSDSSDDEFYFGYRSGDSIHGTSSTVACEVLKSLVSSVSNVERNLFADTTKIVERNKICNCKRKEECRKAVIEGLVVLGYDASICKSRWEKSPSYPSGEYEYIDVIIEGERLLIDVDFKSEFEIARSTKNYRSILQSLPSIFVGKSDRLRQIVSIVSDAAKQSLKKKGMHIPPWRKTEYMRAKWLSPYTRTTANSADDPIEPVAPDNDQSGIDPKTKSCLIKTKNFSGDFELIFKEKSLTSGDSEDRLVQEEKITVVVTPWEPPAIKPKSCQKGTKMVAGLASILKEKP